MSGRRRQFLVGCLLVGFTLLIVQFARGQTHVGYVLDIKGRWFLEDRPTELLKASQRLPAKGVIRVLSPAVDDYIVVAKLNGDALTSRYCKPVESCQRSIVLPGSSDSEKSAFGVIFEAAMELIFGAPQRYSVHRARENNETMKEAIIQLDNGTLDLSDSLREMPRGAYSVTLTKIPLNQGQSISSQSASPVIIDWIPGKSALISNPLLTPGVWEIRTLRTDENPYLASPNVSWILLIDKTRFDTVNREFAEAVAGTERWGKTVPLESKRRVLRACLDHLALAVRQ